MEMPAPAIAYYPTMVLPAAVNLLTHQKVANIRYTVKTHCRQPANGHHNQ